MAGYSSSPTSETSSEDAIQRLVASGAREGRTLEFKEEVYDITNKDQNVSSRARRELFADLIAFANTDGGTLILGIEEVDEVAVAAPGVPLDVATDFARRLPELLLRNVEPPLRAVESEVIPLSTDSSKAFVVLRIRRSLDAPHRDASTRIFHERLGAQKNPMDIDRVRVAFLSGEIAYSAFDEFRSRRVATLLADQSRPGGAWWGKGFPTICLHAAPFHALTRHARRQIDFRKLNPQSTMANAEVIDATTYNAEGFLRYTKAVEGNQGGFGFQVFHNGMYECIAAGRKWKNALVLVESDIGRLIAQSWNHLKLLQSHLGASPWLASVTTWNLANTELGLPNDRIPKSTVPSDEPIYCNDVRFEELPQTVTEFATMLAPSLQPLYTAFKLPGVELPLSPEWWTKLQEE